MIIATSSIYMTSLKIREYNISCLVAMTNEYNIKTIVALLYKTNDNIVHSLGCSTWEICYLIRDN